MSVSFNRSRENCIGDPIGEGGSCGESERNSEENSSAMVPRVSWNGSEVRSTGRLGRPHRRRPGRMAMQAGQSHPMHLANNGPTCCGKRDDLSVPGVMGLSVVRPADDEEWTGFLRPVPASPGCLRFAEPQLMAQRRHHGQMKDERALEVGDAGEDVRKHGRDRQRQCLIQAAGSSLISRLP